MSTPARAGTRRGTTNDPIRHRFPVDGLDLVAWEWPGSGDPILLVHATGFHSRCWDAVVEALPGKRVLALDLPSHGRSARRIPPYDWRRFGADVRESLAALGLQRVLGVGHSMGGHALLLAAAAAPRDFRALMLLDPVIIEPESARRMRVPRAAEHPIGRRRAHWESSEAMFTAFRSRAPYAAWEPRVLRDYCDYGLEPDPGGGFRLACPPLLEAEVYASVSMEHIMEAIETVRIPVDVIRARSRVPADSPFDFGPSATWEQLAEELPHGHDEQLAESSHFFPMERPRWLAQRILRADLEYGATMQH